MLTLAEMTIDKVSSQVLQLIRGLDSRITQNKRLFYCEQDIKMEMWVVQSTV